MENIMTMEEVRNLPQNMCEAAKNAAKTMLLTRKIHKMLEQGDDLATVITRCLPLMDPARIHKDAEQMEAGVRDAYASMNEDVDETWIEEHLNKALVNLTNKERVVYLSNLANMAPAESMDEEKAEKIAAVRAKDAATDADISFLVDVVKDAVKENAGILSRSSMIAVDKAMHLISEEVVSEFTEVGVETARAYAAASYIMNECGETPWSAEGMTINQVPYIVGADAVANVESSKLMALYWSGKLKLTVLCEKLEKLIKIVTTVACAYMVHVKVTTILVGPIVEILILFGGLYFGPWAVVIGSVVIATVLSFKLISYEFCEECVNDLWRLVKEAWNGVKNVWNALFHKDRDVEIGAMVSDEETEEFCKAAAEIIEDAEEICKAAEEEEEEEEAEAY